MVFSHVYHFTLTYTEFYLLSPASAASTQSHKIFQQLFFILGLCPYYLDNSNTSNKLCHFSVFFPGHFLIWWTRILKYSKAVATFHSRWVEHLLLICDSSFLFFTVSYLRVRWPSSLRNGGLVSWRNPWWGTSLEAWWKPGQTVSTRSHISICLLNMSRALQESCKAGLMFY